MAAGFLWWWNRLYLEFFRDMLGTPPAKELNATKAKVTNRAGTIFLEKQVPVLLMKYEVDTVPELEEKSLSLPTLRAQFVEQVLASELERKYVPYKFELKGEPAQAKDFTATQDAVREKLSAERRNEEIRKFRERSMARTAVWTLWPDDIPGGRPLEERLHWQD